MYKKALLSLSILFFMLGFITCLNDILLPFLKKAFKLDYGQAALIQFCFFGAYGLMSIPSSKVIEKIGYRKTMKLGFSIAATGCLLFYPAVVLVKYPLFLLALFVLASGVVMLLVAANPYVSQLGSVATASSRLSMVQAFNSFGTFIAPFFGAIFILSHMSSAEVSAVQVPYFIIAGALLCGAFTISFINLPNVHVTTEKPVTWRQTLSNRNLTWGMLGLFAYVGAEVAIGSFLLNYVMEMTPRPPEQAANTVAIYWGGAMAGRFLGIFTLKEFEPRRVLIFHALIAFCLILISINSKGLMAVYSMMLVGFFNSIMFPSIFTLSIQGMNGSTQKASGLLSTSVIGGAIIPLLTGYLADAMGLRMGFVIPGLCYIYIAYFGYRFSQQESEYSEEYAEAG